MASQTYSTALMTPATVDVDIETQPTDESKSLLGYEPKFGALDFGQMTLVSVLSLEGATVVSKTQAVLHDISAAVKQGTSLGIFGGTREGRSKLLNAFGGNVKACVPSLLAQSKMGLSKGEEVTKNLRSSVISRLGNMLYPCSTPLEEFQFNISLRNTALSKQEVLHRANTLVRALGLEAVKSKQVKMLSPAENMLTRIGIELAAEPDVLCIEDAFEGLRETQDRFIIAKAIAALASSKRCLVVYSNATCDSIAFETLQEAMVLDPKSNEVLVPVSTKAMFPPGSFGITPVDHAAVTMKSSASKFRQSLVASTTSSGVSSPSDTEKNLGEIQTPAVPAGALQTFRALLSREFRFTNRDARMFKARIASAVVVGTVAALVFMYTADQSQGANYTAVAHMASTILLIFLGGMGALVPNSMIITQTKMAMMRESKAGLYSPLSYFVARLIPEMIVNFLVCCVMIVLTYWAVRWNSHFFYLVGILFLYIEACVSYSHLIGYLVDTLGPAVGLSFFSMLPQFLFIGSFVKITTMPIFLQWLAYICSMTFGIRLMLLEEFDLSKCTTPFICLQWNTIMTGNLITRADEWWYFLTLALGFFLLPRLVALALAHKRLRGWRTLGVN